MAQDDAWPRIDDEQLRAALDSGRVAAIDVVQEAAERLEVLEAELEALVLEAIGRLEVIVDRAVAAATEVVEGPVHKSLGDLKLGLGVVGVLLVGVGVFGLVAPEQFRAWFPFILGAFTALLGVGLLALSVRLGRAQRETGPLARRIVTWHAELPRQDLRDAVAAVRLGTTAVRAGHKLHKRRQAKKADRAAAAEDNAQEADADS